MISGWGRSAGAVIPALGSGRYSPGPHIVLPSWRKGSALNFTTNVVWGQPGALATVSKIGELCGKAHEGWRPAKRTTTFAALMVGPLLARQGLRYVPPEQAAA